MKMHPQPLLREHVPQFNVTLAANAQDLTEALRLRYRVFVQELGADGPTVDHQNGLETDTFDAQSDHLILRDTKRPLGQQVVGAYRLLQQEKADGIGGFYTEAEFDLSRLKSSGRRLLELGRSCVAPEYRGGTALMHLWQAVGRYVADHKIEVLFGTASFQGIGAAVDENALALLHHDHLIPQTLRPQVRGCDVRKMDRLSATEFDRKAAQRAMPALIKSYLRMGGCVGEGAFVDHQFNTTDVCMVVDVAGISPRQRALYAQSDP